MGDETVTVQRLEGGARLDVPAAALRRAHWTGFVGHSRWLDETRLAAYVSCDEIPAGLRMEFGHTCSHEPPPHEIKVLVVKKKPQGAA